MTLLCGRDSDQETVGQDKLDRVAAAESDARKAYATEAGKCGWSERFGFASKNTFDVFARALLFSAFRAWLEFINASRHDFKRQQNESAHF